MGCEPALVRLCTIFDELGDDRANGLSVSLEAVPDMPAITSVPLSGSRIDLGCLAETGDGSDDVADVEADTTVVVGVDGRETVWCLFNGGGWGSGERGCMVLISDAVVFIRSRDGCAVVVVVVVVDDNFTEGKT